MCLDRTKRPPFVRLAYTIPRRRAALLFAKVSCSEYTMSVRVNLPRMLARAVSYYGKVYEVTESEALGRLLSGLETMIVEGVSLGEIGRDWQRVARETLELVRKEAALVAPVVDQSVEGGGTFAPIDPIVQPTDGSLPDLEVSTKLRSGYVGVYANGSRGWRAQVPALAADGARSGPRFLGTRSTPLLAAQDRRAYFVEHKLPYGPLAETVEWLRSRHPEMSDEQLLQEARELDALKPPA